MTDAAEVLGAPVAIIGGGVVGVSMAVALARQQVHSVVLEQASGPNNHPRAHVANPRTLEIFRLWGVEEEVRAAGLPSAATGRFEWLTAISGSQLGEIHYAREVLGTDVTLTPEVSCAQDVIESILRRRLVALTGQKLHYAACVTDIVQESDGSVLLEVQGGSQFVRARYVIAADGASSPTRKRLGIPMEGPEELARFVSIYLHADLSRWTEKLPAVLYWIVNARVQGVFISMDGRSRYVFHLRIDPARERFEEYTPERCRAIMRDAIGADLLDLEIRKVGQWVMSGQVAERYRMGNVFLVGDSGHRFPPTGGWGMNTGIQDAHNLAWKIAGVLSGWAPEALLDTYESERRPVADVNRSRSVSNFTRLEDLATWSLDPLPIIARLEDPGPAGEAEHARFRAEVERQREHFDKLGHELGFCYRQGALVPEATHASSSASASSDHSLVPLVRVGARLPLVRMKRPDGSALATTDLFEREFVLLANGSASWQDATSRIAREGVPITCLEMGRELVDPNGSWSTTSETRAGGAILVRPDGHVALRCRTVPEDPDAMLVAAMETILRRLAR